jgi:hypothetical protein
VAELGAVNRELQLRVKVLEDDRSGLLNKVGGKSFYGHHHNFFFAARFKGN